jgi:ubiquinone/menaquinone biosynthesis C-methylase UbiE
MKPRATLTLLIFGFSITTGASAQSSDSLTPGRILQAVDVRQGGTICEIGAGDGEISIAMARIVGPSGRVYSSELGDARIRKLRDRVAASGVAQITVVAGDAARTNFPDGGCDGVLLRDVYHHFTDPESMNLAISSALKPGGRVAVIDFSPPGTVASCPKERAAEGQHGVDPETVSREMERAGLAPVSAELSGQRWFMIVLSKPQQPGRE